MSISLNIPPSRQTLQNGQQYGQGNQQGFEMTLWKKNITPQEINQLSSDSMISYLGIEVHEIGSDYLIATMPVNERTRQPFGYLHGGASCVLAETVASIAANLCLDEHKMAVGQSLDSHHLLPVQSGTISALTKPIRIGKSSQVWQIEINDDQKRLINLSHLTVSIVSK